jgi:hypothetical protein
MDVVRLAPAPGTSAGPSEPVVVALRLGGDGPPEPADLRILVDGADETGRCRRRMDLAWPPRRLDLVLAAPGGGWAAGEHDVRVEARTLAEPVAWRFTVEAG